MFEKHCFVGILMVSDENSLIRIHTKMSWIRNTAFVILIYYRSGIVINFGSGSNFLTSYGSGSTRKKVTVPQHWFQIPLFSTCFFQVVLQCASLQNTAEI